ncbi:LysM peptidoglycan-binding domain-containing protein [Arthrobacter subterraneus]|uniref:LysM peptidoglycan-binding domain-containing protein n=1 Tax=Arthrobacter subterraneus TaxID=335973 RepID=UPI00380BECE0
MSKNRHIARHRAESPSTMQVVSKAVSSHAGTVGRPAAVLVAASGIMFGAALPASAGTTTTSATVPAVEAGVQATPVAAPAAPAPVVNAPTHTVQAGDTLGSIAASYGVSLEAVFAANGLGWDSIIYPGQVISLSGSAAAAPAPAAPAPVAPAPAAPAPVAPAPQVAPAPVETSTMGITTASSSFTVADSSGSATGASILASARAQLAAGAIQDCTVLLEKALGTGDLGPAQFAAYGTQVSSPAPGDIVISAGHVAVYAGGGQVISSGMNGANLTMQHPLSDLGAVSFYRA